MDELRNYLETANCSQAELAERLGCHPSLISQWLNGHTRMTGEWAVVVEKETGVPRSKLRRDLFESNGQAA